MKPVPADFVNFTLATFDSYSDKKVRKVFTQFDKRQPYLSEYLREVSEINEWNEVEASSVLMFAIMAWTMMNRHDATGMHVPNETDVLDMQYANERQFNKMNEGAEDAFPAQVFKMIDDHNQPGVMGFIISSVLTASMDNHTIRQFQVPNIILYLKTIVDAMDMKKD